MNKYDAVDSAILEELENKPGIAYFQLNAALYDLISTNHPDQDAFRVLDRRLQALRKKAMIIFNKGWHKQG